MSTKTISKRIALATVVALGAGVLSLVSVSSASAANNTAAGSTTSTGAAAGVLTIGTAANTTGVPIVDTSTGTTDASVGLLAIGDIAGNKVAGTTQTATLISSGSLVVSGGTTASATLANSTVVISVTGGTIVPGGAAAGSTTSYSASSTVAYNTAGNAIAITNIAGALFGIVIKPNSGATTMTVNQYGFANATPATDVGTPTSGTLTGSIAVSLASASVAGTVSLTTSSINYNAPGTFTAAGTTAASLSSSGSYSGSSAVGVGVSPYAFAQYAAVVPKDAYGTVLGSAHLVQASASNGAVVALSQVAGAGQDAAPASAGTISSAFATTYGGVAVGMAVGAGTLAATGGSTIVTVSVDGVAIGAKSFTFTGKVAKAVLSNWGNGLVGSTGASNWVGFKLYDAAGNQITFDSNTSAGSSAYPASFTKDTNGFKALGADLGTITWPVAATATTTPTGGYFVYKCAQAVTDAVQIDYSNPDGSVVVSNSAPMSCSGTANSYTAKLDKTSYTPGQIATLSVTFKDINGALAADNAGNITSNTAATVPSISGGDLTAVTAATQTDGTTNGVATYKFIVGSTDGSYQLIASFPTVNALNSAQSAQTVSYTVASGSTSLNDVLKGIVSLIASINKQIAALAKLVAPKAVAKKK
jgi:hypothetical protein